MRQAHWLARAVGPASSGIRDGDESGAGRPERPDRLLLCNTDLRFFFFTLPATAATEDASFGSLSPFSPPPSSCIFRGGRDGPVRRGSFLPPAAGGGPAHVAARFVSSAPVRSSRSRQKRKRLCRKG